MVGGTYMYSVFFKYMRRYMHVLRSGMHIGINFKHANIPSFSARFATLFNGSQIKDFESAMVEE